MVEFDSHKSNTINNEWTGIKSQSVNQIESRVYFEYLLLKEY